MSNPRISGLAPAVPDRESFASEVRKGLSHPTQKTLPCRYLYDDVGTALFEAITRLPEYGLTRADERLIELCAGEVAELLGGPRIVIELGSGSGRKTRRLLEAFGRGVYFPIDVSSAALEICRTELSPFAQVIPVEDDYLTGAARVLGRRRPGVRAIVLFLGSTLGNFDRAEALDFLSALGLLLLPGDGLLLGTDLVKPPETLITAYDDPAGVTAAFNRNLLARINRELDGSFNLDLFRHEARYSAEHRRIEMHLVSLREQRVEVRRAGIQAAFRRGETIWTESSHKFDRLELRALASRAGFHPAAEWIDEEWPFAENLWLRSAPPSHDFRYHF